MSGPRRPSNLRRGQPVIALGLVLTAWVGARAMLFEQSVRVEAPSSAAADQRSVGSPARHSHGPAAVRADRAAPTGRVQAVRQELPLPPAPSLSTLVPSAPAPLAPAPSAPQFDKGRIAAGHQLLWIAAVQPPQELPPEPAQLTTPAPAAE